MDTIDYRPVEETAYFEDGVPMQSSKDGQMQMMDWLTFECPWNPVVDDAAANSQQPGTIPHYRAGQPNHDAFMYYRSTGLRSESDTVPGDSGYGSCVILSAENTSVCGEDPFCAVAQDIDPELRSFPLNLQDPLTPGSAYNNQKFQEGSPIVAGTPDGKFLCRGCSKWVRTRSDLKKHERRHSKPFNCPRRDCSRHEYGFASQNDLARHRRTVHEEYGDEKTYVCRLGDCSKKDKRWPRADNFRSHLQRVHKLKVEAEDDLSQYLYHQPGPQPIANVLSDVGTHLEVSQQQSQGQGLVPTHQLANEAIGEFPEIPTPATSPTHISTAQMLCNDRLLMPTPSANGEPPCIEPNVLHGGRRVFSPPGDAPQRISGSPRATKTEPSTAKLYFQGNSCHREIPDRETESNSSPVDKRGDNEPPNFLLEEKTNMSYARTNLPSNEMGEDQSQIVAYLKKLPKHLLRDALADGTDHGESEQTAPSASSELGKACDICKKAFSRRCDLRKHLKRHERPYGCTVYLCKKSFGSKNDWKRHENGQHNQTERWYCGSTCQLSFNRREKFEAHLRECHNMMHQETINEKLEKNRQGSHCRGFFWCGFCQASIPVCPDNFVEERFDHIDNHFMGRGQFRKEGIENWVHEEDLAVGGPCTQTGRKRKSSVQMNTRAAKQPCTKSV